LRREDVELKVELLCRGARVSEECWHAYKRSAGFQAFLGDVLVSIPSWGRYRRYRYAERSPYQIRMQGSRWLLCRGGKAVRELTVHLRPRFYDMRTSDGVEMWRVFQVCGHNCLLTGVRQTCAYMRGGAQCKFCGTIFNPRYEGRLDRKRPEQLAEAAERGAEEGMRHVVLSTGVSKKPDRGVHEIAEAAKAIKERVELPIQAEVAVPSEVSMLEELSPFVDSISINIETLDQRIREEACPDKSKIPYSDYFKAYELSLRLFGENQVNSWLIAGLGEEDEKVIEGARTLAEMGVYPFLVPLRPTVRTAFEHRSPPSPERMMRLSREVAEIVREAGLEPRRNRAGCMRCSACSAVKDYVYL